MATISEDIPAVNQNQKNQTVTKVVKVLKAQDNIQYRITNNYNWKAAKVLMRAGRASGKYKNWDNIQEDVRKEKKSINQEQVQWEQIQESVKFRKAFKTTGDSHDTAAAKLKEVEKLCYFETYEEVNDYTHTTLSTRRIVTGKNGQTKAPLVGDLKEIITCQVIYKL